MNKLLTEKKLRKLIKSERATALPYKAGGEEGVVVVSVRYSEDFGGESVCDAGSEENAKYIEAACNAVPALVREVRKLRKELREYENGPGAYYPRQ